MKNKKKTKNRTLRNTKWERRRSRARVVYRNYRTPVGEVRGNLFKTRGRNSKKRFQVAELVRSGRQCRKQKKNPIKEDDITLVTEKCRSIIDFQK